MIVSVVAGGWSFKSVDHAKLPGVVIAVNDSLVHLQRPPAYTVSMDRLWMQNRWENIRNSAGLVYLRDTACRGDTMSYKNVRLFENHNDGRAFSHTPTHLNGQNSGACALNLAFVLRPKQLYMFGFDMCISPQGKPYWYPVYPWKNGTKTSGYDEWPKHMEGYARQFKDIGCEVFNVSPASKITAFTKYSAEELCLAP